MTRKPVALIFTATQGHFSLGKAVSQIISPYYKTHLIKPSIPNLIPNSYKFIYQYFPGTFKIPFELGKISNIADLAKKYFLQKHLSFISTQLLRHRPQLIINSFPVAFLPALEELIPNLKNCQFLNLVPNPRTFHPLEFSLHYPNLVYDQQSVKDAQKINIPNHLLHPIGWPVRQEFFSSSSTKNKQSNPLHFLICGGSEGTTTMTKILPSLLSSSQPLKLTFICGHNQLLFDFLQLTQKQVQKLKPQLEITIKKFTSTLHQDLHQADLVIGKAGPNLLFETTAAGKPFLAVTHIAGQETGNLQIIKKQKLGFIAENPLKAHQLIKKILHQPQILNKFTSSIKKQQQILKATPKHLLAHVFQGVDPKPSL